MAVSKPCTLLEGLHQIALKQSGLRLRVVHAGTNEELESMELIWGQTCAFEMHGLRITKGIGHDGRRQVSHGLRLGCRHQLWCQMRHTFGW